MIPSVFSGKSPEFRLFGIFGHPLSHTLSPCMQEAGFQKLGLKAFYLPFALDARQFRSVMKDLSRHMLDGFNVTVPYKEDVLPFLDGISPEAKAIGAVNTVYRHGSKWLGTNTDAFGFITALKQWGKFQVRGKNVLVLGAGGSARAVLYALAKEGVSRILVVNRNPRRALELVTHFHILFKKVSFESLELASCDFKSVLSDVDLVINTTSVGLKLGEKSLIRRKDIPKAAEKKIGFVDLIYSPAQTDFLKQAKLQGQRTLNGLGMLLYQGAKSFECWTGKKPPIETMKKALLEGLKTK